jgi:hypothetical protein
MAIIAANADGLALNPRAAVGWLLLLRRRRHLVNRRAGAVRAIAPSTWPSSLAPTTNTGYGGSPIHWLFCLLPKW